MDYRPKHFIGTQVEVVFDEEPLLEKKPGCPDRFLWQDELHEITDVLMEWHDYRRRGRSSRNMRPSHAVAAERRGSWGVGQDYYRVRTSEGRIFDLYYDRAPQDADHRKGGWFLDKELESGHG